VRDRVEELALLLIHEFAVLRRARNEHVVGDHDGSVVQPATVQDALQVGQVGAFVVVDEQEVELPGCEAVLGAQRVERSAAVTNGADDAGDPVGDAGMGPDTLRHFGVGGRALDGEHLGRRRRTGDPQRAVAAVGAQLQRQGGVGAANGSV